MRTLLRHLVTGLYFEAPDTWTDNPEKAFDFKFIDRAVSYARTWRLTEVELAFSWDDVECIITTTLERATMRWAA